MTQAQLDAFRQMKVALRERERRARDELEFCSSAELENNAKCDHRFPDGRDAGPNKLVIGPNRVLVCAICGCSARRFYERQLASSA